ncbi:MAG: chemotaxis protein CheW [Mariprofundus sp.]
MDEELLGEFLTESRENMDSIEEQLMALESNPNDEEMVNAIFRVIHTVKGSCGFIGLVRLEKVAHAGENLLGKIRSLKFEVNEDIVSLLLECADAINALLTGIEADRAEPELDHSALIHRLQAAEQLVDAMAAGNEMPVAQAEKNINPAPAPEVSEDKPVSSQDDSVLKTETDEVTPEDWLEGYDESLYAELRGKGWMSPEQVVEAGFASLRSLDGMAPADALKILGAAKAVISKGGVVKKVAAPVVEESVAEPIKEDVDPEPLPETPPARIEKARVKEKRPAVATVKASTPPVVQKPVSAGSIRVDVELLDSLMNQVGELVLIRNRLMSMIVESGSMDFMRVGREVDHVTERLQAQLLRARMQPIKTIWGTVPRVVRDICKQLNKKINVVMEGEETELDRTILNAIKDPLTHIIRNSCDHGIEMPADRRSAGKSDAGTLRLSAAQESGYIVILIVDDGAGIPADKVKAKAVTMGVISEAEAAVMNEHTALQLIFHAGLSTAEKVSNFSGRGVGMDVVRTEIEKVGGSVDISSTLGTGTTLRIRIPLTLAIISAMIVGCRDRRFAVPQISIRELLSAPASSEDWRIIGGQPFFRLRGRLMPVLELAQSLQLDQDSRHAGSIVVIDAGDRTLGLLVDTIYGAEEVVVKPLGIHFSQLGQYGGCSILGDGAVIPILDCNGLAQMMCVSEEGKAAVQATVEEEHQHRQEMQHVLVFSHEKLRYAIPMALIERLEKFPLTRLEASGGSEVLQYRDGEVIPVLRWGTLIEHPCEASEEVYGLILSDGHHRMCLQVNDIEDILEVPLDIKKPSQQEFFLGTTVIMDKITEVVDAFDVIKKAVPDWFEKVVVDANQQRTRILFAEDTAFFRNLVIPVLESMNFEVWLAHDGEQARQILQNDVPDIVLTDIEMPNMDGYQLTAWIRSQQHLQSLPVVALTATPPDENDKERRSGFDDVLIKFDRHSLVDNLRKILKAHSTKGASSTVDAHIIHGEVSQ